MKCRNHTRIKNAVFAYAYRFKDICLKTTFNTRKYMTRLATSSRKAFRKAVDFKDAIGYYAVLTIVLVALSAAAYDYRGKKNERARIDENVQQGIPVQVQSDPTLQPDVAETHFVMPVNGALIAEFADDKLVWSTTLQMWQTHPAVDIAAFAGEAVIAAADGEVIEAYSDALLGNTITIDHGSGRIVRYASLNTIELASVGQKVKQGDIIGSVGTCTAEAEIGAHIHLEYINRGIYEDFLLLLNKNESGNLRD